MNKYKVSVTRYVEGKTEIDAVFNFFNLSKDIEHEFRQACLRIGEHTGLPLTVMPEIEVRVIKQGG